MDVLVKEEEECQVAGVHVYLPVELWGLTAIKDESCSDTGSVDVRDVLSIEVWNEVLTEEDRISLSKFLPGGLLECAQTGGVERSGGKLDDLLRGNKNVFFGDPTSRFWEHLQKGYYSKHVAQYREASKHLDYVLHLHNVMEHHNGMSGRLKVMKDLWDKIDDECRQRENNICNEQDTITNNGSNPLMYISTCLSEDGSIDEKKLLSLKCLEWKRQKLELLKAASPSETAPSLIGNFSTLKKKRWIDVEEYDEEDLDGHVKKRKTSKKKQSLDKNHNVLEDDDNQALVVAGDKGYLSSLGAESMDSMQAVKKERKKKKRKDNDGIVKSNIHKSPITITQEQLEEEIKGASPSLLLIITLLLRDAGETTSGDGLSIDEIVDTLSKWNHSVMTPIKEEAFFGQTELNLILYRLKTSVALAVPFALLYLSRPRCLNFPNLPIVTYDSGTEKWKYAGNRFGHVFTSYLMINESYYFQNDENQNAAAVNDVPVKDQNLMAPKPGNESPGNKCVSKEKKVNTRNASKKNKTAEAASEDETLLTKDVIDREIFSLTAMEEEFAILLFRNGGCNVTSVKVEGGSTIGCWREHKDSEKDTGDQEDGDVGSGKRKSPKRSARAKGKANKSVLTILKKSVEELKSLHQEENCRFEVPDRPYVYTISNNNYYKNVKNTALVGPIRGGSGRGNFKNRDHSLLVSDRPSHASLITLVCDGIARLPGGVGTRKDVCMLVEESQYVKENCTNESTTPNAFMSRSTRKSPIATVVSGALDRLGTHEDSIVKFDYDTKLWTYCYGDHVPSLDV